MMRFLRSVLLAIAFMLVTMPVATASSQWCEADPLLVITTPRGSAVPVYVTTSANGVEHLAAATAAQISYSVSPSANGKTTLVTVTVLVPNDAFGPFAIKNTVSSGPLATGVTYASTAGASGKPSKLTFVLNEP
jgi:hypothetical protein